PFLYQDVDGARQTVEGHYVLQGGNQVGFAVGAYNAALPLVIDPTLSYATYLGGNSTDQGFGVAVDGAGNAYVTGLALSTNFPITPGSLDGSQNGNYDVFVSKFNAAGSLVYSTYVGGSGDDRGFGISLDSSGNAYVSGMTASSDYPVVNAF